MVDTMKQHEIDVMFTYTVTMGLVALLMAWVMAVLVFKGWAIRSERRRRQTVASWFEMDGRDTE